MLICPRVLPPWNGPTNFDSNRPIIRVRPTGPFLLADYIKMVDEILADGRWSTGMNALMDHRNLDLDRVGYHEIVGLAMMHETRDKQVGSGKTAIVVSGSANLGISYMYDTIASANVSSTIRVFTDIDEAEKWLGA